MIDWLDLLAVQGTLKSLLQHQSSKASILQCSPFFVVLLSQPYMTTEKAIALTRWTFVNKVITLLFNILSRLVITFLPSEGGHRQNRLHLESRTPSWTGLWTSSYTHSIYGNNIPTGKPGPQKEEPQGSYLDFP